MPDKKEDAKVVEKKPDAKKVKTLSTVGKRKKAVARAHLREGKGVVRINKKALSTIMPELLRMKISEPFMIAGNEITGTIDITVNVIGGGINSQTEAARQAIARGLVEWVKNKKELRQKFITYDRSLLVYDPRRTEPHKCSRSSKGARRKRQLSKR
ncbi:MAG: 30S ribosomal protein S9 [Candidatus Aenigmarchaeota archaeon]|nr:30S ribosomal protein S9 [Candidatus Aenigmarchaeota archaeon]